MAKRIKLDIVTPERLAYSDEVNMIIARATDGDLGILPGHAPLIAGLQVAPLRLLKDEGEEQIAICSGFLEVQSDKVTILAACAELPGEIDVKRAQAAKERAESRLRSAGEDIDIARAEMALKRALLRLSIADHAKK